MWFWEGGDCGEVFFTVKRKIFTYPQMADGRRDCVVP